ncbi:MAG: sugar phosphate isomerase/epimerase [Planctomycetota bacterium]|nr:MAG: sugar phosphate isomerase/epimerase [Planctomycetota bacterium]
MPEVAEALANLEFTSIEIALRENGTALSPSRIAQEFERAAWLAVRSHRLDVCAYDVHIEATGVEYFKQFDAICKLGKITKVVTLTVPSAELGTPFNEEVERLQKLVDIAEGEGVRVGMKSQHGCLSGDPDTVKVLCDNVKGLGLTLDPSHYMVGGFDLKRLDKIMPYVYHVHLRDSTKDNLHVRVGQGTVDFGRIINMLERVGYEHALSIQMDPLPGLDQAAELRKLGLLLQTMV